MSLPDELLKLKKVKTQVDFEHYVKSYKTNFTLLKQAVDDDNVAAIDYRKIYHELGKNHVAARDRLGKLLREQEIEHYNEVAKQRQAFETRNELAMLAKLWGNAGPPTMNSQIKRSLMANKREAKKYEAARLEQSDWQQQLRFGYYSHEVNLQWMELPEVPKGLLNTLAPATLTAVRLTGNNIFTLPTSICILASLEELNVSNNKLSQIPDSVQYLGKLAILDVSYNRIPKLPVTLAKVKSLRRLSAQGNILNELPHNIGGLTGLVECFLQQNKLTWIPLSFKDLLSLNILNLSENGFAALSLLPSYSDDWGNRGGVLTNESIEESIELWTRVIGPGMEDTFVDLSTGLAQRSLPECVLMNKPYDLKTINYSGEPEWKIKSIAALKEQVKMTDSMKLVLQERAEARKRRLRLKADGKREWEALADTFTGDTFFFNHITHERKQKMPKMLDHFGELRNLIKLQINTGQIQRLPDSMFYQKRPLQILEVKMNRLKWLQESIFNLEHLRELRVPGNQLVKLPDGLGKCSQLKILDVTANNIQMLPSSLGDCVQLNNLYLSHNRIRALPPSLQACTELRDVMVGHNLLDDKIQDELEMFGIPGFLREMRERFHCEKRGKPPSGKVDIKYGVDGGLEQKNIRHHAAFIKELEKAKVTKVLHYFWKNFDDLGSNDLLKLNDLVDLRLTGNSITTVPESLSVLSSLRILVLRRNKIKTMAEKALRGSMSCLEVLDLADNKLNRLPERIFRCRNIRELSLQNNVLTKLPEDIGKMRQLRILSVQINQITQLPESLADLRKITVLNFERNLLSDIPASFSRLKQLESLNVNHNNFTFIPDVVGELRSLAELQIASNSISEFTDGFVNGPLTTVLTKLWLQNNKMVDLPLSFANLKQLKDCRFDGNPLRSPPITIAEEGVSSVERYLVERMRRETLLLEGLRNLNFEIDPKALYPRTKGLFTGTRAGTGGSGFLLHEDIDMFDYRIDTYLNADIYQCKWTGPEILADIDALRYKRGRETYQCLINIMLRCLKRLTGSVSKCKWYEGDEVMSELVTRPWGENGEETQCFHFTIRVLIDGAHAKRSLLSLMANGRHPQLTGNDIDGYVLNRNEIHEGFEGRLLDEKNHLDIEIPLIVEALEKYRGPYGQCSGVEPMQTECHCSKPHPSVEDEREKHLVHEAGCIQKIVFTDDEAARKKQEDYDIKVYGKLIERKTELELDSGNAGVKTLRMKAKQLKEETTENLRDCKEELKLAQNKASKANVDVENMRKRKALYDNAPSAVEVHGFASLRQAEQAVVKLEKLKAEADTAFSGVLDKDQMLRSRKKMSAKQWREEAKRAILAEKREEERRRIIQDNRIDAMKLGHRRPWDGENGEDFIRWVAARKGGEDGAVSPGEESDSSTEDEVVDDDDSSSSSSSSSSEDDSALLLGDVSSASGSDDSGGSSDEESGSVLTGDDDETTTVNSEETGDSKSTASS